MMAAVGLGWTVLPAAMAGDELQILRVADTALRRQLGIVRHGERSLSRAAQAFMALTREEAVRA